MKLKTFLGSDDEEVNDQVDAWIKDLNIVSPGDQLAVISSTSGYVSETQYVSPMRFLSVVYRLMPRNGSGLLVPGSGGQR